MKCFLFDHLSCPQSPLIAILENVLERTPSLFFISIIAILDTLSHPAAFHSGLLQMHSSLDTFYNLF